MLTSMYPMYALRWFQKLDTFQVQKEVEFDAGHRVPLHASKCRNPHGHRYRVRATVEGTLRQSGSSTGMVVDFGDLKALLTERVHDRYDHGFVVWEDDFALRTCLTDAAAPEQWKVIVEPWHPTAENMAKAILVFIEMRSLGTATSSYTSHRRILGAL